MLAAGTPLIDLRAPAEFARGAVPGAANLPLLTDDERARVGTTYRQAGQSAAVRLGHELVSGAVRSERVDRWRAFATCHPDAWLYCWRGGLRSELVQDWLRKAGLEVPRVPGGYKALRRACLATLAEAALDAKPWIVLGGRTGTGKTELLRVRSAAIDLEALARHRGSAFGALPGGQPTLISFENALAVAWLRHGASTLLIEDESRTIGRNAVPEAWFARMQAAPIVLLEADLDERCARIEAEYVSVPLAEGQPAADLEARLAGALDRIRRRLGGLRHAAIRSALAEGFRTGAHRTWIRALLEQYYDPMYDYQLEAKRARIAFAGPGADVAAWLDAHDA
jgi:tRNA 2-selenouridine synthase